MTERIATVKNTETTETTKTARGKIAIFGAGAMGTVLGAWLNLCGVKADLIARNEAHVSAINARGARVICKADGERVLTARANAVTPDRIKEKYDVIFLMTKQRDNASIVRFLKDYLSNDGIIVTTQNGLPERSVAEIIGCERTFGGVCAWGANFKGAGEAELTSDLAAASMRVGAYAQNSAQAEKKLTELEGILSRVSTVTGAPFYSVADNLAGARWSKLSINAAFSGLSALTGLTFGEISKNRALKKIAIGILRECFLVASASGVTLEKMQGHNMEKLLGGHGFLADVKASVLLPVAMRRHGRLISGMLLDIRRGKKCEIDFITGAVVKAAREAGVAAPLCERVTELVHGIENGFYEITAKNAAFFEF